MWFDVAAALAEVAGGEKVETEPGPRANPANRANPALPNSTNSTISTPPQPKITPTELARDLYEERAAIREYDGGQDRAEAEAAAWQEAIRVAGITALDE